MSNTNRISDMDFDVTSAKQQAIRYWERRRWVFLALLIPPTVFYYLATCELPAAIGDRRAMSKSEILIGFFCAFIGANICYSFAYAVEFFFFGSPRYSAYVARGRTMWFVLGCAFGMILAAGTARAIALAVYPVSYR